MLSSYENLLGNDINWHAIIFAGIHTGKTNRIDHISDGGTPGSTHLCGFTFTQSLQLLPVEMCNVWGGGAKVVSRSS